MRVGIDLHIKNGDIIIADLGPVIGSEQGGIRPAVVIQNDLGNLYSPTIIIAPITSKTKKYIPTHVFISSNESGLPKDSTILIEQIRTIDKARIIKKVSHLSDNAIQRVKKTLKINFNIRGDIFEFLKEMYGK